MEIERNCYAILRNHQNVSQSGWTISRFHQQCMGVPVSPPFQQHLLLYFSITASLVGVKQYVTTVLICIPLMTNNVENHLCAYYPFIYLLWWNVHSDRLPIFKLCFFFVISLMSCKSTLYILDTGYINNSDMFSPILWLVFWFVW